MLDEAGRAFAAFGVPGFRYREIQREERAGECAHRLGWGWDSFTRHSLEPRRPRPSWTAFTVLLDAEGAGVGRTTLLVNAAHRLAGLAQRCALVDLNPDNAIASWFGIRGPGLVHGRRDWFLGVPLLTAIAFGEATPDEIATLGAKAAAEPDWILRLLTPILTPRCEIVLVDAPPGSSPWRERARGLADLRITCVRPGLLADEGATRQCLDRIAGTDDAVLVIGFDDRVQRQREIVAALEGVAGRRVLPCRLRFDRRAVRATEERRLISVAARDSQLDEDVASFVDWLQADYRRRRRLVRGRATSILTGLS